LFGPSGLLSPAGCSQQSAAFVADPSGLTQHLPVEGLQPKPHPAQIAPPSVVKSQRAPSAHVHFVQTLPGPHAPLQQFFPSLFEQSPGAPSPPQHTLFDAVG
jgi:hypothetical protein